MTLRRLAALLTVVVIVLLFSAPSTTSAAPEDDTAGTRFAKITIDSMTPTMVTTTSATTVSIAGAVTNTSDRTIHDLTVRLERGDAVASAAGLRTSLAVDHPPIAVAGAFRPLATDLKPGAQVPFRINVPLSKDGGLQISRPGVYPLQVNVNGVPDYGSTAQVAGSRLLLPVLSLPPDTDRAQQYEAAEDSDTSPDGTSTDGPSAQDDATDDSGLGPDGSVSANLSSPARMTMLWPLAAPPQLAPGVLGGNTEPVRLISEDLARALDDGGRLHTLLAALADVVGAPPAADAGDGSSSTDTSDDSPAPAPPPPPPAARMAGGLCVAVDPDLLVTVRAMSLGYEVTTDPGNPRAPTVEGTGTDVAARWLTELRRVATRLCVVALPFAQADLSSLARIQNAGLSTAAVAAPADIIDAILGVRSVRNLAIPALGGIDAAGAKILTDNTIGGVALASSTITPGSGRPAGGDYRIGGLGVQTYDLPISAAFGALGTEPSTPALTPADQQVAIDAESPVSRRQTAVASMAFPSISVPRRGAGPARMPTTGRSELIVPPTYWSPTLDDISSLFSTARLLLESGAAVGTTLDDIATGLLTTKTPAALAVGSRAGRVAEIGSVLTPQTTDGIADAAETSWQLQGALVSSADVAASPERYMSPLREDLLRAIRSPSGPGEVIREQLAGAQRLRVNAVASTLRRMRAAVTILDPGGRYTLASERSPVLLVVRNGLDLPVRVKISTDAPPDLNIGDVGVVEIPANGTRQIQLPTEAESSEAITLGITLSTVTGVPLGEPIELSLRSNAYGKVLFIITIIAAVALVLLVARRLWHRFRGQPDPADVDRPEPDEVERLLAGSSYQERRRNLQDEHDDAGPPPEHPEEDKQR